MLEINNFKCEGCKNFCSDGIDGNHPYCTKSWGHKPVKVFEKCAWFEPGVPMGYEVNMERNRKKSRKILEMLGIEAIN